MTQLLFCFARAESGLSSDREESAMSRKSFSAMAFVALATALPMSTPAAMAQTAPSPSERATYTGLLAVTATGAHNEIIQLLVNGVDPDQRDSFGRTPYLVAAHRADLAAMELLVKGGANPRVMDSQAYDAITITAVANQPEALRKAIALGGDVKAITSPYEGSALIAAAHLGHGEVVRILIAAGASLDHVNNLGWTAVIEAIVLGDGGVNHTQVLRDLLAAGASPLIADRNGKTPCALAQARGYRQMADMIRAKGGC
jgi:uncharacterized protein